MFSKDELNHSYRYCLSLTYNEEQAYDLLQTSLEKYLKRVKISKAPDNPRGYLKRIIKNQFIDQKRSDSKKEILNFDEIEESIIQIDEKSLENIIINKNEIEVVLQQLSSDEREFLFLWAVEGLTIQEIADDYNIPKGSLLSKIHRMKKRIQRWNQLKNTSVEVHNE